jgi:hypothetical protein
MNETETVYLVCGETDYEGYDVEVAFRTREAADAYVTAHTDSCGGGTMAPGDCHDARKCHRYATCLNKYDSVKIREVELR